ncbi:hypothetical protein BFW38_01990 [Terasakiispira papahanaumokuakeensis]|uniref:Uncharacterized protein n=1 Tax=Terasakiispira papahanaumokuakeensis TaxID=197479 RepID=A0A1E2V687_9GAMM|nr:hypothetical protein BFW38_01990 [Terasakiispira papahanaumokuakeensis]
MHRLHKAFWHIMPMMMLWVGQHMKSVGGEQVGLVLTGLYATCATPIYAALHNHNFDYSALHKKVKYSLQIFVSE